MRFFTLFRIEEVQDHHDEEHGNRHAQQNTQKHLPDEMEAKRLQEKQGKMMHQHQTGHIAQEPRSAQLPDVGLLNVLQLLVSRNQTQYGRATERHQGGGSRMQSRRAGKHVDAKSQDKAQAQHLPFGHGDRKQHNENQVDVWMHVAT